MHNFFKTPGRRPDTFLRIHSQVAKAFLNRNNIEQKYFSMSRSNARYGSGLIAPVVVIKDQSGFKLGSLSPGY